MIAAVSLGPAPRAARSRRAGRAEGPVYTRTAYSCTPYGGSLLQLTRMGYSCSPYGESLLQL